MAASEKQTRSFCLETGAVAMRDGLLMLPDHMLVTILVLLVPPWTDGSKRLAANKCMNKITETHTAFIGHVAATKSLSRCFVLTAQIPASIPSWCFGVLICADFNEDMLQQLGGMCHNVSSFYIEYPQITNVGLSHLLARCSSLTNVVLDSSPNVTDEVFELLAASTGLKFLGLSGCHNLRGAPESMSYLKMSCRNVVTLDLSDTEITPTALSLLGTQFLTTLCLINSKLTDASLQSIADKSPNLTSLFISSCAITNAGMDAIAAGCPAIRSLALDGCDISDPTLRRIGEACPFITDLDLSKCPEITDAGLLALAAGCKIIRVMHLSGCNQINNSGTLGIAPLSKLLELRTLILEGCELGEHTIGLCGLWAACPNVTILCLSDWIGISDAQLHLVAVHLHSLTDLDLNCCSKITNEGLWSLGHWCTTLTTLDISHCKKIGDEGMAYLAGGCKRLATLIISHCQIGDAGMAYLAGCKRLNTLDMSHCTGVTITGLSAMAAGCLDIAVIKIKGCACLVALCSPEGRMCTPTGHAILPATCQVIV